MKIIIKGARGFEIYDDNKDYLMDKFQKFEKLVKEPATMEVVFEHTHGTRANLDKVIKATLTLPGLKKPMHWEEISVHYTETIDRLYERIDDFLRKFKEKLQEKR